MYKRQRSLAAPQDQRGVRIASSTVPSHKALRADGERGRDFAGRTGRKRQRLASRRQSTQVAVIAGYEKALELPIAGPAKRILQVRQRQRVGTHGSRGGSDAQRGKSVQKAAAGKVYGQRVW